MRENSVHNLSSPQRGQFKSQEEFEEARSRWRWTVGRNQAFAGSPAEPARDTTRPDQMQPAIGAIEAWHEQGNAEYQPPLQETNPMQPAEDALIQWFKEQGMTPLGKESEAPQLPDDHQPDLRLEDSEVDSLLDRHPGLTREEAIRHLEAFGG